LELGESLGIELPFGCRRGVCTKCQQTVEGEVDYPNGHESDPDEGKTLLCCSVPKGDVTIDA
jgi:ferredoxin